MDVLRHVVAPIASAFAVFVFVVIAAWRRPVPVAQPVRTTRGLVVTVAAGYTCFLAIVAVFHVWLSSDPDAFASAVTGGLVLLAICAPVFTLLSWVDRRR